MPPRSSADDRVDLPLVGFSSYYGNDVDELRAALSALFSPVHLELDRGERLCGTRISKTFLRKSVVAYHRIGAKCVDGDLRVQEYYASFA